MKVRRELDCLGCGVPLQPTFIELGDTPLANSYVAMGQSEAAEERLRLALAYCEACHLVQLADVVPPERLFTDYPYFSSFSDSFLAHAREMADSLSERFGLGSSSRVLEIASNDGYLLQYFRLRHIPVLGIEPARNIAAEAARRGIPTVNRFFGVDAVDDIMASFGRADLIIGNNVLGHVPDVNGFLRAVAACLEPGRAAVFEVPYLRDLLEKTQFDTIYHEHVFYYSLHALNGLVCRAGLELFDVSRQAVHGGSLRVFMQHPGAGPVAREVADMLADEVAVGLTSPEHYDSFGRSVATLKQELVSMLSGLKASGKRLAAYGAPAKGNTLLNYCGIGTDLLEFTVDRSPHKQGRMLPGSHLPILAPEALVEQQLDYALILPWNLADEIVAQQRPYLDRGGKFIVPIPHPMILGTADYSPVSAQTRFASE
jgi:hypothetical protein